MATAGIFGALAGLANTGEQLAGANQNIAKDKAASEAAAAKEQERQDAIAYRRKTAADALAAKMAKKPLGNPFQNAEGKMVQRFYDPSSRQVTIEAIGGDASGVPAAKPAKPTPEDQKLAFWKSLGFSDEQIKRMASVEGGLIARPSSKKSGTGGAPTPAQQAAIDGYMQNVVSGKWTIDKVPAALRNQVASQMYAAGLTPGSKLTVAEQNSQDSARDLVPMVDQALTMLEPHKEETGGWSAFKQHVAKGVYGSGISPGKDEENILQSISFLQLLGVQPWTKTGRGKYIFEQIEPHLPKAGDSLGLTYQKLETLRSLLPFLMAQPTDSAPGGGSIDDQILRALTQQQATQ